MGCWDYSINNPQNTSLISWLLTWNITFWVKYSIKKSGDFLCSRLYIVFAFMVIWPWKETFTFPEKDARYSSTFLWLWLKVYQHWFYWLHNGKYLVKQSGFKFIVKSIRGIHPIFHIEYFTQNVIFHIKGHVTKHVFWELLILKS